MVLCHLLSAEFSVAEVDDMTRDALWECRRKWQGKGMTAYLACLCRQFSDLVIGIVGVGMQQMSRQPNQIQGETSMLRPLLSVSAQLTSLVVMLLGAVASIWIWRNRYVLGLPTNGNTPFVTLVYVADAGILVAGIIALCFWKMVAVMLEGLDIM